MDKESVTLEEAVIPNAMDHVAEMVDLNEPDFLLELLDTFLSESAHLIDQLQGEWTDENSEQVLLIAHSLKSSCATFCAQPLSKLAEALENEMRDRSGRLDVAAQISKMVAEYARVNAALHSERLRLQAKMNAGT